MIRIPRQHLLNISLSYKCHPAADSRSRQFPLIHQFIHILTRASHQYCRLGKRQVLLTLQVNHRLHSIHEILLPLLTSLFCFRLTLLAAKLLHSTPRHELFTAILTLSNCFHFLVTFVSFTFILFSLPLSQPSCTNVARCQLRPHRDYLRIRPSCFVTLCTPS